MNLVITIFAQTFWTNNTYPVLTIQPKKKDHKEIPTAIFDSACLISPTYRKKISPNWKAPKKPYKMRTNT